MQRIIKTAILLFWFVMLGLLIHRSYIKPSSVIALDVITEEGVHAGDEWFGIYQQDRKIGYAHTRIIQEGATYHLIDESELDIRVLDNVQRVRTVINSYASKNFLLQYFDFTLQSPQSSMKIKGFVDKQHLILDIMTGGQTRTERIKLNEAPYLSPNLKPALVLRGLSPGRTYRFSVFNPVTMSSEDAFITVEGKESIKVGDQEMPVYKLKESYQGMETTSWLSEEGETIKEESPLGYKLLRESPSEAVKLDKRGPSVDILAMTMIPSDHIKESSRTTYLKAGIKGVSLQGFDLEGGRQSLKGSIIEVRVLPGDASYSLPFSEQKFAAFLAPTTLIQSDDPAIRKQAASILGKERDPSLAAKKLNEWVYENLQKKPVISIPSAVEVLKQKVGDCNEHTALYTALARSAGIPTRMAAGIVYMKNGFYYHAWPEVWLGTWFAVDPTFNQFPADATHIRFVSGSLDRQTEIMRLVGKLRIEVTEYR